MKFSADSPFIALHRPLRVAYACVKPAIWISLAAMVLWLLTVALIALVTRGTLDPRFLLQLGTGYCIVLVLSILLHLWFSETAYRQAGFWVHERYGLHLSHTQVLLLLTGWYRQVTEPGEHGDEYGTIAHEGKVLMLVEAKAGCKLMHVNASEGMCELPYQQHKCDCV